MLFLRLTWVIGQAGLIEGLLIISLCNIVTIITSLSMSAVCTNGQIKAGGIYYMISRSLGKMRKTYFILKDKQSFKMNHFRSGIRRCHRSDVYPGEFHRRVHVLDWFLRVLAWHVGAICRRVHEHPQCRTNQRHSFDFLHHPLSDLVLSHRWNGLGHQGANGSLGNLSDITFYDQAGLVWHI